MAKGDKKEVKQEVQQEQNRVNDQYNNIYSDMEAKRIAYEQQSQRERDNLTGSLTPWMQEQSGGLDPTVVSNIRNLYGGKSVGFESTPSGGSSGGSSGGGGNDNPSGGSPAPVTPQQPSLLDQAESTWKNFNTTGGVDMARMQAQIGELENMAKTGGFRPEDLAGVNDTIAKLKAFQYDPAAKAQVESSIAALSEMGRTGGYDPERLARINWDLDRLRSASETGGVDPVELNKQRSAIDFMRSGGISNEDLALWRGTGYDEFSKTGGWSDEERAEFRNRSTSAIPSLFNTTRNEAERLRNIQGGTGGAGFLAASARLNRNAGQDLATASRNAEIDMGNSIREGRKWGIEGLRDTEQMIQDQYGKNRTAGLAASNTLELGIGANRAKMLDDLIRGETTLGQNIAGNKIAANTAAGQLQVDLSNSINDAIQKSLTGAGTIEANIATALAANRVKSQEAAAQAEATAQRLRQEGQQAGAQGLMQIAAQKEAAARAAQGQANAARANDQANERWWAQFVAGNEQWIGEQQMQGQQNAARNLTQIYGMDPTLPRDSFTTGLAGEQAGANARLLSIDSANANAGKDNNWMDYARLGLGALNSFGGGGGSSQAPSVVRPTGDINNYDANDIGGAIDTGSGSSIWDIPQNPSDDQWWYGR